MILCYGRGLVTTAQQVSHSTMLKYGDAGVGVPARQYHCHMRRSTSLVKGHFSLSTTWLFKREGKSLEIASDMPKPWSTLH
jgi:hypothetical protein